MNYYRTGWKVRSAAAVVQWKPLTRVSSFSNLQVVDKFLGISTCGVRDRDQSKVFMFIAEGQVVGFLLAETIQK